MALFEVHVFAHDRAKELVARQAIAGVLNKSSSALLFNETKRHAGTVSITLEITIEQYRQIAILPGIQVIRPPH